jgi:hypothetical protein
MSGAPLGSQLPSASSNEQLSNRRTGSLNPVLFLRLFITEGFDTRRLEEAKALLADLCS